MNSVTACARQYIAVSHGREISLAVFLARPSTARRGSDIVSRNRNELSYRRGKTPRVLSLASVRQEEYLPPKAQLRYCESRSPTRRLLNRRSFPTGFAAGSRFMRVETLIDSALIDDVVLAITRRQPFETSSHNSSVTHLTLVFTPGLRDRPDSRGKSGVSSAIGYHGRGALALAG
jgi:hypothetical protein